MALLSQLEEELFEAVRKLTDPAERRAYLEAACLERPVLLDRVEQLLAAAAGAEDFFAEGESALQQSILAVTITEKPGDLIGHYKLLQKVGEGGCGVVYMAEQNEPVRRRVALKIIKLGMDTRSVIARFEAERQALAMMEHPNIAKVFDAGATDTGRPFFVMELVRGIKITQYCDEHHLTPAERIELFIKVCHAVQHAHQKGVVHRDLQPANILVTINDGVAVPKVIDFGIAKATEGRLTEHTLFTAFQQFLGTPAYMSPEQTGMTSLDVDTRSDIYSLGVLLYELLTGKTPFDGKALLASGLEQMRRTIQEQEPQRPSNRLRGMGQAELTTTASFRRSDPPRLLSILRGDLDWIVMKCIEKDRSRRYETANAFALDLGRFLNHEPVVARPPSKIYRFQKFVRRNRLAFLAGAAVASAVLLLAIGSTVAALRLERSSQLLQKANDLGLERLRASYLTQARAQRTSGRAGQRFESLEALSAAALVRPGPDLRDEAIAAMAVCDLRIQKSALLRTQDLDHVHFSASTGRYAIDDRVGNVLIRSLIDDAEGATLPTFGSTARWLNFSPNGEFLAVGYSGGAIRVWHVPTGRPVIMGPKGNDSAAFTPDNRFFARSGPAGIVFYDLSSGSEARRLPAKASFKCLAFSPDGSRLAAVRESDSAIEIMETGSGEPLVITPNQPALLSLIWSPDAKLLAGACQDQRVRLWNAEDGSLRATLGAMGDNVMSLGFNHSGNLLAASCWDDTIRFWNPLDGREIVRYPGITWQIQFSSDDQYVPLFSPSTFDLLRVVQSHEYRRTHIKRLGRRGGSIDFSADGKIIAATTEEGVRFCDLASGAEIGWLGSGWCDSLIFTSDGKRFLTSERTAGMCSRTLQKSNSDSTGRLSKPDLIYPVKDLRQAALARDGIHLAVADHSQHRNVVIDLRKLSAITVLPDDSAPDYIDISPDGHWVATGYWDLSEVKVWDAHSGKIECKLNAPARTKVVFSPDGRWLATSSTDYQLWEVGTWQARKRPIPGHPSKHVTSLAFSPDSRMMAIAPEGIIQLIEPESGRLLARLEAPDSSVISTLRFSPDGTQLAALERDQEIQLWDLRLIRRQLAEMHLDWELPAYPPLPETAPGKRVKLEIESNPFSTENY